MTGLVNEDKKLENYFFKITAQQETTELKTAAGTITQKTGSNSYRCISLLLGKDFICMEKSIQRTVVDRCSQGKAGSAEGIGESGWFQKLRFK